MEWTSQSLVVRDGDDYHGPGAVVYAIAPDALLVRTRWAGEPVLHHEKVTVSHRCELQWFHQDPESALLLSVDRAGFRWMVLLTNWDSMDEAEELAREYLRRPLDDLLQADARRMAASRPLPDAAPEEAARHRLAEHWIRSALRPPSGIVPQRWTASGDPSNPVFDLNDLFPAVCAWLRLDRRVATEIVQAAVATVQPDGAVHRLVYPAAVPPPSVAVAPWPLLARCARMVWQAGASDDFLGEMTVVLPRYAEWILRRFDPAGSGLPRWMAAEESLIPEVWADTIVSVDLAVLLIGEIEATLDLCRAAGVTPMREADLQAARERLLGRLQTFFLHPEKNMLFDRFEESRHIARVTWSSLLALDIPSVSESVRQNTLAWIRERGTGPESGGVPLWERWESDEIAPSLPAFHQLFLLDLLARGDSRSLAAGVRQSIRSVLSRSPVLAGGDPDSTPVSPPTGLEYAYAAPFRAGDVSLATVVLWFDLLHREERLDVASASRGPMLLWLDRHIRPIMILAVVAAVAAAALLGYRFSRGGMTSQTKNTLFGMALNYYKNGQPDEALVLFEELLKEKDANPGLVRFHMGNAYYKKKNYSEAEKNYRIAIQTDSTLPMSAFNLIQSIHEQHRREESVRLFREFEQLYGAQYPELVIRLRRSLDIRD